MEQTVFNIINKTRGFRIRKRIISLFQPNLIGTNFIVIYVISYENKRGYTTFRFCNAQSAYIVALVVSLFILINIIVRVRNMFK